MYPSKSLYELIGGLESTFLKVVCENGVYPTVLYDILEELSCQNDKLICVGCENHNKKLTFDIIDIFLLISGKFLTKAYNNFENAAQQKTRELRKQAKY